MGREPRHYKDRGPIESVRHFFGQFPRLFWWVALFLTVVTIVGLTAAFITQSQTENPGVQETPGLPTVPVEADQVGVMITVAGFQPATVDLPAGKSLVLRNDSGEPCGLLFEGDPIFTIDPSATHEWVPNEPGTFTFSCSPGPSGELVVTAR